MTQLTDKGHWAVEVADDIKNSHFYRVNNEAIMFKWEDTDHPLNIHDVVCVDRFHGDLKDYKWPTFLFTTKGMTEHNAIQIVRSCTWYFPERHIRFVDYAHPYDHENKQRWSEGFATAVESFQSLLRSKGCDTDKNWAIIQK